MITRREFLAAAGCAAAGCAALPKTGFYGPTIRDRLWMWGHHPESGGIPPSGFPARRYADQAEGCRLMGIPNDCVVRWCDAPRHPWGDYFEQFRALKRFSFSITDGAAGTVYDKMKICFEELQPKFPNLTGCFLDDFFVDAGLNTGRDELAAIADQVHAHGLRLSVVLYSDQDGLKPEFKSRLDLCDETSFWFWSGGNIPTMADQVRRCREFIGPDKDLLLGLYMWDFGARKAITGAQMEQQLAFARRFLADRTVTGLIFHPSFAANMDIDSVRLSKAWIREHGDCAWGV